MFKLSRKWVFLLVPAAAVLLAAGAHAAAPGCQGISLAAPAGRDATPGDLVTYCFTLTNDAAATPGLHVALRSSAGWTVLTDVAEVQLDPGEDAVIAVSLIVPADAPAGAEDRLELTLTDDTGLEAARASVTTRVKERNDFELSAPAPVTAEPGGTIVLPFALVNMGNVPDTYTCEAASDHGWRIAPRNTVLDLAPLEMRTVECTVTVPLRAARDATDTVTVVVRSKATGRAQEASARITVGGVGTDGEIPAGEDTYVLSGEIGGSICASAAGGDYSQYWIGLWGPLEPDEWVELSLRMMHHAAGIELTELLLLYRTLDYQLQVGGFSSPWSGLTGPGTNRAGLDILYRWDEEQLELTVGTPSTLPLSFAPMWYALTWSRHWTSLDLAVRLLQTDIGINESGSPYLDASLDWHGRNRFFSADLALGLDDFSSSGSFYYGWQGGRLGWHGGLSWADRLNGDGFRCSVLLGGAYQWEPDHRLGLDLGLSHGDATGANPEYYTGKAALTLNLGRDLALYVSANGTWFDSTDWLLDKAEYLLGLGYALSNPGSPYRFALELAGTEQPGAPSDYSLRFKGEYRVFLERTPGELSASLYAVAAPDQFQEFILQNIQINLGYKDGIGDEIDYAFGLTLNYPDVLLSANAEFIRDIGRDTTLTGHLLLSTDDLQVRLRIVRLFSLGIPRPHGTISGVVFQDLNTDGKQDPGEPGLGGVGILLDGVELGRSMPDGHWVLSGVAPGSCLVDLDCGFDPTLRSMATPKPVKIKPGANIALALPLIRLALLYGRVYIDRDGDGRLGPGDRPLPDIPAILTRPDGRRETAVTSQDGGCLFPGLAPGVYRIVLGREGLPADAVLPEPTEVIVAQEYDLTVDLPVVEKAKPVVVTFIATPKLAATASALEVFPGGLVEIVVTADMPLSRVEVSLGALVLADHPLDDDSWTGTVRMPAGQPLGPVSLTVRAWDGDGGPGVAQVALLVVRARTSPRLTAAASSSKVRPGGTVTLQVAADMTLTKVETMLAGEEPWMTAADGPTWTGTIVIPADRLPGPLAVTLRGWDGGEALGTVEVVLVVEPAEGVTAPVARPALRICFDVDSAAIGEESLAVLARVAEILKEDPDLGLMIDGHIDSTGSVAYNQMLSLERAKNAGAYLVEHFGIAPDRLQVVGLGESEPIGDNVTVEGRALNRCVEFVWLELEMMAL